MDWLGPLGSRCGAAVPSGLRGAGCAGGWYPDGRWAGGEYAVAGSQTAAPGLVAVGLGRGLVAVRIRRRLVAVGLCRRRRGFPRSGGLVGAMSRRRDRRWRAIGKPRGRRRSERLHGSGLGPADHRALRGGSGVVRCRRARRRSSGATVRGRIRLRGSALGIRLRGTRGEVLGWARNGRGVEADRRGSQSRAGLRGGGFGLRSGAIGPQLRPGGTRGGLRPLGDRRRRVRRVVSAERALDVLGERGSRLDLRSVADDLALVRNPDVAGAGRCILERDQRRPAAEAPLLDQQPAGDPRVPGSIQTSSRWPTLAP